MIATYRHVAVVALLATVSSLAVVSGARSGPTQMKAETTVQAPPVTHYRTAKVDGVDIFYRAYRPDRQGDQT